MRVLHVFEPIRRPATPWFLPGTGTDCAAEAALLAARDCLPDLSGSHETILLGGARDARWAALLGLPRPRTLSPTLGIGALARNTLHRYTTDSGPFRHVVFWTPGAARAAGRRLRRNCSVSTVDLRTGVVCTTHPDASRATHPIPSSPATPSSPADPRPRWAQRLRARRNLAPTDTVIGVLGNTDGAAVILAHVLGILQVAGLHPRGLAHRDTGGLRRARRLAAEGYPFIHAAEAPSSVLLAACDIAILVTGDAGPEAPWARTLLAAAHARGVPVIRRASADGGAPAPGLICNSESPADFARVIRRWLEASRASTESPSVGVPDVLAALRHAEMPA